MSNNSIFTVSNLVSYIKQQLKNDYLLANVTVVGEIGNFTNHYSGHWYFSLKDSNAFINCAMFKSANSKLDFIPENGQQVIAFGSINIFEKSGTLQIVVSNLKPFGKGNFYQQFEKTKQKLMPLGYFDSDRKKPIPLYPKTIAVVTGANTAALQDIRKTLRNRWPVAEVKEEYALVQGDNASEDIIRALIKADSYNCDVMILARGGGSVDDLFCFNDEKLATAIFNLKTPLVTGIGHEIDTTIADLVADKRAATPTAAAVCCCSDINEVLTSINKTVEIMRNSLEEKINYHSQLIDYYQSVFTSTQQRFLNQLAQIELIKNRLKQAVSLSLINDTSLLTNYVNSLNNALLKLDLTIENGYKQLDTSIASLDSSLKTKIEKENNNLYQIILLLESLNPLKILKRGFTITKRDDRIISEKAQLNINDEITVQFSDGNISAKVTGKE
ncbi:MAG: exodeoxyribonuclease VII large subunit [Erysipelotrichaceae bacterium]